MLTVRLLGFFRLFRKRNLRPFGQGFDNSNAAAARPESVGKTTVSAKRAPLALMFMAALLLAVPAMPPDAQAAKSAEEEEEGQPYIGRDSAGNRVFGTDDKADAGFGRDSGTGDRVFKTSPPKQQEDQSGYNGPIWVTPEVTPGKPPHRPRVPQ